MEKRIQKQILDYLKNVGAYAIKNIVSNRTGIPDLVVCYKGRFIALEVKQAGKKATELQIYNMTKITDSGGTTAVVYCVEDVKRIIEMTYESR